MGERLTQLVELGLDPPLAPLFSLSLMNEWMGHASGRESDGPHASIQAFLDTVRRRRDPERGRGKRQGVRVLLLEGRVWVRSYRLMQVDIG